MKTLFMLMNHALTQEQEEDARKNLDVGKFVNIADAMWSDIDPSEKSVIKIVEIYKDRLRSQAKAGDVLLVQGDFGATYNMIRFAKSMGLIVVYATTNRIVSEQVENGKAVIKREFKHARFREYEEL
ncbi:CRISPR-associated protein Csx20 [uncultured Campylobacter sp.]|uniref:CRISPR-associated protein Csx20 n=1 Tax=uncultured Campylobacter sp. TaxID=218934 RepID=UPI0026067CD4|nr:CRISPR-associated protein Csx20 [uncultured Campylobacter sp.]